MAQQSLSSIKVARRYKRKASFCSLVPSMRSLKLIRIVLLGSFYFSLGAESERPEAQMPDIGQCAKRNFPKEAKKHVDKALVTVSIVVGKDGKVRSVKVLKVELVKITNKEKAPDTIPMFEKAGVESLLNQICPVFTIHGEAKSYRIEVPLLYEIQ